ncbi:NAD(P)/FAD-dependent oxidoreductase [Halalkalicoccus ordinarius]|uniref:NAD(P)/FAD-dependent oxidoreductase n=1 Tax=Halalkalicoccus ordinarius TaxID=3116651 RepID=UPI00300F5A09
MHVVIVGGGVIGTSLAAALGDRTEVTLLERGELGGGTTAASMAMLHRQQVPVSAYDQRLRRFAREGYDSIDGSPTEIGSLYVAESEGFAAELREAEERLNEEGVDTRYLEPVDLDEFGIAPSEVAGGMYTPEERYFEPEELVARFAERARDAGVEIRTGVEVTDVDPGEGVVADGERIDADAVVNAAGPWAPEIDHAVDLEYPLRHTRGPILSLETGADRPEPFSLFERGSYCRSRPEGLYVGRFATDYGEGERLDPDATLEVDDAFRDAVEDFASAVPAIEGAPTAEEWVGVRTVTPDGHPLVGETEVESYFVATGMSGLGVTLAPAVARLLADLLVEGTRNDLLEPLDPGRFGGK